MAFKGVSAQEGTKDICMWFMSNKKCRQEIGTKGRVREFYTTRFNILIPILISGGVFIVEICSVYHAAEECWNWLDIFRLLNTTFIPTHIATATGFLYQHFSLDNYYNNSEKKQLGNNVRIKSENVGITMVSTILMGFFYVVCSFKISWGNQIFLIIMQCIYMFMIFKYFVNDKIVSYEELVENVVSY